METSNHQNLIFSRDPGSCYTSPDQKQLEAQIGSFVGGRICLPLRPRRKWQVQIASVIGNAIANVAFIGTG